MEGECKRAVPSMFFGAPDNLMSDLSKNPQKEVSCHLRLEGGGDDDIVSCRKAEPIGDLPCIEEEGHLGAAGVVPEEICVQLESRLTARRQLVEEETNK